MIRRLVFALMVLVSLYGMVAAQSGGQLCVRSFEDRNGNGTLDPGEPLLTRGVGVNLLDSSGVTIASSLLDTSPTAAQGVVCFQFLPAGQYSVVMTSADYTATTPDTITTTISDSGLPTVVEFGARLAATPTSAASPTGAQAVDTTRVAVSGMAALLVVGFMVFLGMIVFWSAFGRRAPVDARVTTGSMRAVRDTGTAPRVSDTGSMRRVTDTGEVRSPRDTGAARRVEDDDPFHIPDDLP
ncbi:MAG: hypothetical protein HZC41_21765 [Chloroflexi bacterium]|nr:hypothetical protein [Chloroflexota bacterium]